jgi:hypothetical protein
MIIKANVSVCDITDRNYGKYIEGAAAIAVVQPVAGVLYSGLVLSILQRMI